MWNFREIVVSKKFGIPISVSIGVFAWLFGTGISLCRFIDYPAGVPQSASSGCESSSLIGWVINHGNWPYGSGFWEPYWVPVVLSLLTLAIWIGISFFIKTRTVRDTPAKEVK